MGVGTTGLAGWGGGVSADPLRPPPPWSFNSLSCSFPLSSLSASLRGCLDSSSDSEHLDAFSPKDRLPARPGGGAGLRALPACPVEGQLRTVFYGTVFQSVKAGAPH